MIRIHNRRAAHPAATARKLFATVCATAFSLAAVLPVHAREVMTLNEGWRFFFKSENSADGARYVTLPHTWNTDPQAEGQFLATTGNYLNILFIPREWSQKRLFLKFYGAQTVADLFVNGRHAGTHRGGGTAFTFEITDRVRFGSDNTLQVVVSNSDRNDVLPTSTDINRYGGLYREVELIVTDQTAISPLYLGSEGLLVRTTQADSLKAAGSIEVHLASKHDAYGTLNIGIADEEGNTVFTRQQRVRLNGTPVRMPFEVARPALWSPATPSLYTVTAAIEDGDMSDEVSVRTGFRSLAVTAPDGSVALPGAATHPSPSPSAAPEEYAQAALLINGTPQPVHGIVLYHDSALRSGALRSEDYEEDLARIDDLGATAIRSAVMPHAPYLYDRCDETGLLVWIDLPFHRVFMGDAAYYPTPQFEQNGLEQLQEIIAQNINHPSVVMWGIFSNLWMRNDDATPYITKLDNAARTLDPTRLTVACSDQDGVLNFLTDLIVWRQSVGWEHGTPDDLAVWSDQMRSSWSHLRSAVCYGGSGFLGQQSLAALQDVMPADWAPEERQTRFHEGYARMVDADSLFWGVWVANLFDYGSVRRPYGINAEGLVTLDRRTCKDAYYLYRALWNRREPTLRIADRRRPFRDSDMHSFRVYSSAGAPTVLVGADTLQMYEYAPCQYQSDTVRVQGWVEIKATAGALRDSLTIRANNVAKPRVTPGLRQTGGRR